MDGNRGVRSWVKGGFVAIMFGIVSVLPLAAQEQAADIAEEDIPQEDAEAAALVQAAAAGDPKAIEELGGEEMAQSAMSGTGSAEAGNTGSTTGGQPLANAFNFQTDLFSGRFTYTVPIVPAPARQGAQPALALAYNSGGGNGWCGVGWLLDVGFIQRDTRRGVPIKWVAGETSPRKEYDDAKCFIANFGGVNACLVAVGTNGSTVEYRAEVDTTFLKFLCHASTNTWEVIDKGGNHFYFGQSASSRMVNTNAGWSQTAPSGTFRWAFDRVVDVNSNTTTLTYTKDGELPYLSQISYNGNPGASGEINTIEFSLGSRSDKTISYQTGYRVETRKLLTNVTVKANGALVRQYSLVYTSSPSTFRSLLKSVTTVGTDGSSTLPPLTFSYQVKPFEFGTETDWATLQSQGQTDSEWNALRSVNDNYDYRHDLIDIDGDGLADRVMRKFGTPYTHFVVQRNTGSGFASTNIWGTLDSQGETDGHWNSPRAADSTGETSVDMVDIDGDGLPDRVMRKVGSPYTNFFVQFNLGSPFPTGFTTARIWGPVTAESTAQQWRSVRYGATHTPVTFMDMNGDGWPDRVMRRLDPPYTNSFKVQFNTGSGFSGLVDWSPLSSQSHTNDHWNSPAATDGDGDVYQGLYDINGDGLPDRVMISDTNTAEFKVQFNNGSGFEETLSVWSPVDDQGAGPDWNLIDVAVGSSGVIGVRLHDMNGDGLPDRVMRPANSPYGKFLVQFNTGSGFTATSNWTGVTAQGDSTGDWNAIAWTSTSNNDVVDLLDINGDGLPDRVMRKYSPSYTHYVVQTNKGPFPDLLFEIKNGIGGEVTVSYTPSTQYDNRDKDWGGVGDPWKTNAISKLAFPVWTVSSITVATSSPRMSP